MYKHFAKSPRRLLHRLALQAFAAAFTASMISQRSPTCCTAQLVAAQPRSGRLVANELHGALDAPRSSISFSERAATTWEEGLLLAGRPNSGFVSEAFVSPRYPEIGKPVFLVLCVKNVHISRQTVSSFSHYVPGDFIYGGANTVLLRDDEGHFLASAKSSTPYHPLSGIDSTAPGRNGFSVLPGYGYRAILRLDTRYTFSRPGKYTVLGAGALCQFRNR